MRLYTVPSLLGLLGLLATVIVVRAQFQTKKTLSWNNEKLLPLSDQCFCKLEGQIDDCSCKVDTVDHFNNAKIYPRLRSLLTKDYFRYFQYQPHKQCPFWNPSSGKCSSSLCQVKSCSTTELPPGLAQVVKKVEEKDLKDCRAEVGDSVDSSITKKELDSLSMWQKHDEDDNTFCELEDESSCVDCVHVDLTKNPERFTGYSGSASRRIWATIYEENCFSPKGSTTKNSAFSSAFGPKQLGEMCLEKRAFFRVVSGLHTSITIHLAANYPMGKEAPMAPFLETNTDSWGPNLELFHSRFDPSNTEGQGPYWLKNLYFVYLLELRALAKAADYLSAQSYYTGREEEDKETVIAVKELLSLVSSFPEHFDETSMFTGGKLAENLKYEFREHFKNITRVMDCVGCDKCKLWGKLQMTGLGTALKILFSGVLDKTVNSQVNMFGLHRPRGDLTLTRNEIVALFNAFGKISTSIVQLERFREMLRKR